MVSYRLTCSFILESSKVTWTRLTGTNWIDKTTAGLNLLLIISTSSPLDTEGETSIKFKVPYLFGYKPISAISRDPKLLTQKINLINTNCKCIILGYKPRAK